jgi:serine/threonine protein kinase
VYSVGTLLFEMLCGRLPFVSDSEYELLRAQVETDPPPVHQFVSGVPDFVAAAIRQALEKDPRNRYPSCADMATVLREGSSMEGWPLQSVAEALALKPQQSGEAVPEQVRLWCQRIDGLIQSGNFDTAERTSDTALNQFPASAEIALRRERARQRAQRRVSASTDLASLTEAVSEEEQLLRQTLLRLVASEASGDLEQAMATLRAAMERYPERTAYRIAEVYLKGKMAGGGTGDGT